MPQGWTVVPEPTPAAAPAVTPAAPAGWTPVASAPTYRTTNQKDATGAATVDPNTIGTLARHLWAGVNPVQLGQMLPWPKAWGGSGTDNPLNPRAMAEQMAAVKRQAQTALDQGDYVTGAAKYVESFIPVLGPWMSANADKWQRGENMAALGDALALAANVAAPKGVAALQESAYPLAGQAASRSTIAAARKASPQGQLAAFADTHNIDLNAAIVSDNLAIKHAQQAADRSLGGSVVATPANTKVAADMARTGRTLAEDVYQPLVTPLQAGERVKGALEATSAAQAQAAEQAQGAAAASLRREAHPTLVTPLQGGERNVAALADQAAAHTKTADTAYEFIRRQEAQPGNQVTMPGKPTAMSALSDPLVGQLRRIVHELDAAPYTPYQLQEMKHGGALEHVPGTGGAGAAVFDDIVQRAGSRATRGTVQSQLETYLGGGPETPLVKAALEVAGERQAARGGYAVTVPELPPSAMDVPTRLEGAVTGETMGFPVDVKSAKPSIQAVVAQMERQLPITQQQANPGLKALKNILDGPDYGSLSQIDTDLSAIKALARQGSPLAKFAVQKLEKVVMEAAQHGGPDVVRALQEGRKATIAKYRIEDVLGKLNVEPGKVVKQLTAPEDTALGKLRSVVREVPGQAPILARAYLEDLLASSNPVAEWRQLGDETKAILFPKPGQAASIDAYMAVAEDLVKNKRPVDQILGKLSDSPVTLVKRLTAPEDTGIPDLRQVLQHAPQEGPVIARAYLEDLLASPNPVAEWGKLGAETRTLLFPTPGHAAALDQFFALKDRISKTNVNPSGSGPQLAMAAQLAALAGAGMTTLVNPAAGLQLLGIQGGVNVAGAVAAKAFRSPTLIRALTRANSLPVNAPPALVAATRLTLVKALKDAGIPYAAAQAARADPSASGATP